MIRIGIKCGVTGQPENAGKKSGPNERRQPIQQYAAWPMRVQIRQPGGADGSGRNNRAHHHREHLSSTPAALHLWSIETLGNPVEDPLHPCVETLPDFH